MSEWRNGEVGVYLKKQLMDVSYKQTGVYKDGVWRGAENRIIREEQLWENQEALNNKMWMKLN